MNNKTKIIFLTSVSVASKVGPVDEEIMVAVQLPELAVDDVKVLVGKVLGYLVYVLLGLEGRDHGDKVRPPQLGQRYPSRPWPVHAVVDSRDHLEQKKKKKKEKKKNMRQWFSQNNLIENSRLDIWKKKNSLWFGIQQMAVQLGRRSHRL